MQQMTERRKSLKKLMARKRGGVSIAMKLGFLARLQHTISCSTVGEHDEVEVEDPGAKRQGKEDPAPGTSSDTRTRSGRASKPADKYSPGNWAYFKRCKC